MADEVIEDATPETGEPAPLADPATLAKLAKVESATARIASLVSESIDPKGKTKQWGRIGDEFIAHARWQKKNFAAWAEVDHDNLADKVETIVKLTVAVKTVRVETYVRVAAFIEAVKPTVPNVADMPYGQLANKFLPMLAWDKVELTGSIRKDWVSFVHSTVARQLGPDPLSIRALDDAIASEEVRIARDRESKIDPEKQLAREQKAANAKMIAGRKAAVASIDDAITAAIVEQAFTGQDLAEIVANTAKNHNVAIPAATVEVERIVGCDPTQATKADLKTFANALFGLGKVTEMKYLNGLLNRMIAVADAAMAEESAPTTSPAMAEAA